MLILNKLTVHVDNKVILKDINFHFEKNKIYALMGPNGSGKSTLAYGLMGHPAYQVSKESSILFKNKEILKLSPTERAKLGIFLSFQNPQSLSGVTVSQLLQVGLRG